MKHSLSFRRYLLVILTTLLILLELFSIPVISCKAAARSTGKTISGPKITLNARQISLENGETFALQASVSDDTCPVYRSNKKGVAVVDSNGVVTACKPGTAIISVKASKTTVTCRVTVKKPVIKLNHIYAKLFR